MEEYWSGICGLQTLKPQLFYSTSPSVPSPPIASRWISSSILPLKSPRISSISPPSHRMELDQLRARDRVKYALVLQNMVGIVEGTSDVCNGTMRRRWGRSGSRRRVVQTGSSRLRATLK
ncbi:hypothetical protein TB2_005788 [Malus domestica]